MRTLNLIAGACLACACLPVFALDGVYGGARCDGMKFDFRGNGQVAFRARDGRDGSGSYVADGDKITIDVAEGGPDIVLRARGDALLLEQPGVDGKPGDTLQCLKPFEPTGPGQVDPQLQGCWKITKSQVSWDDSPAPKDASADCTMAYGKDSFRQVCKPAGKPPVVTLAKLWVRAPGILLSETTQADAAPRLVGTRHESRYDVSGDTLHVTAFPHDSLPGNKSAIWKVEGFGNRVADSECH